MHVRTYERTDRHFIDRFTLIVRCVRVCVFACACMRACVNVCVCLYMRVYVAYCFLHVRTYERSDPHFSNSTMLIILWIRVCLYMRVFVMYNFMYVHMSV